MRDSLGRQTLLIGKDNDNFNMVVLTSVTAKPIDNMSYMELPPIGIFKITNNRDEQLSVKLYPWKIIHSHTFYTAQLNEIEQFLNNKIVIDNYTLNPYWLENRPDDFYKFDYNFEDILTDFNSNHKPETIFNHLLENENLSNACDELIKILQRSVKERLDATPALCKLCIKHNPISATCTHSKIGILFSGGVDCTILAVLANRILPADWSIDLINVSFEKVRRINDQNIINYNTPDRISAKETLIKLKAICADRYIKTKDTFFIYYIVFTL